MSEIKNIFLKWHWHINILFLLILVVALDFFNVDAEMYQFFYPNEKDYDLKFWEMFGAIGSVGAAIMAWQANSVVQRQLEIEQEPLLIMQSDKLSVIHENVNNDYPLSIKNIGRGPAINTTVSFSEDGKDRAFFEKTEPHSRSYAQNEGDNPSSEEHLQDNIRKKPRIYNAANMRVQLFEQLSKEKISSIDLTVGQKNRLLELLEEVKNNHREVFLYLFCFNHQGDARTFRVHLKCVDTSQPIPACKFDLVPMRVTVVK